MILIRYLQVYESSEMDENIDKAIVRWLNLWNPTMS